MLRKLKTVFIFIGCLVLCACMGKDNIKESSMFDAPVAKTETAKKPAETIASLGRAAIIQLANQQLAASHPDLKILPSDYEISVQANAYEVQVKYRRYVYYYPARLSGAKLHYDLSVDLIAKKIQPFDDIFFAGTFFMETPEDRKNILFVFLGELPKNPGNQYVIVEHDTHFRLINESLYGYGYTEMEVQKATGERTAKPSLSLHPAPYPNDEGQGDSPNPYQWAQIVE